MNAAYFANLKHGSNRFQDKVEVSGETSTPPELDRLAICAVPDNLKMAYFFGNLGVTSSHLSSELLFRTAISC